MIAAKQDADKMSPMGDSGSPVNRIVTEDPCRSTYFMTNYGMNCASSYMANMVSMVFAASDREKYFPSS